MTRICIVVLLALLTIVPNAFAQHADAPQSSPQIDQASDDRQDADGSEVAVVALSDEKLEQLLSQRLNGELGDSFRQFSNMFLVKSKLDFVMGIGLMSKSRKIANAQLQPVYPESYQPTLREFLDVIALQTSSNWKYDNTDQFVQSDMEEVDPISDLAIFEFTPDAKARPKPYQLDLVKGWKTVDHGNWVMHVPPTFPIGFDVYEMGVYSTDEADKTNFYQQIRKDVSLQWARRVVPGAEAGDLVDAKVGDFKALHFTSMIPSQLGKEIRWRQWVFMADNRCFFIVSTILPEKDDEIFPDVEKMLATFKSDEPEALENADEIKEKPAEMMPEKETPEKP